MKKPDHLCSTACVRPIGDVITDLRAKVQSKLPGSPAVAATWSAVNECASRIKEANEALAEDDLSDSRRWMSTAEVSLASSILRRVADSMKVPTMHCGSRR